MAERGALGDVSRLFVRLGFTAFGGPAAHIAMLRREVVERRRWLDDAQFLDLLGATNLIPGPNSTEMAMHVGLRRAGWPGLVVAGVCFILPAACIVLALAWAYERFGALPEVTWLLYGVKPVIMAIVAQALVGLSRTAIKDVTTGAVAAACAGLYLAGANELAVLFGGAVVVYLARRRARRSGGEAQALVPLAFGWAPTAVAAAVQVAPFSLATLFLTFLKIGAVLYGSGYVLLAFLRADFVERLGWLTDRQLLDAVAVGQFTPGPVFTTATFVGYLVGGFAGATLATIAIFLPSFFFVALSAPLVTRVRQSSWAGPLLDGVNASSLGLMAAVTLLLGLAAIVDLPTAALALVAAGLLFRTHVNSAWLVGGGAIAGLLAGLLRA